ncbi:MAG: M1 family metallopeptidase [Chitinophagales bacterium]
MNYFSLFMSMILCLSFSLDSLAQTNTNQNKFRQLGQELPTPNVYRTASGSPGHEYWQQKANYDIKVVLNDKTQRIDGQETITYYNNSPDELTYLWIQLDQNIRAKDSDAKKVEIMSITKDKMSWRKMKGLHNDFDGGFKIKEVKGKSGKALKYTINKTMMRVDLPKPLKAGGNFSFSIKWWYNLNDRMEIGGRSGYEYFEEDDNYLYTIAQFYPRMAVYNEVEGWQHKQFLGRGEFALPFGDFKVSITVPSDHLIAATGVLQNPNEVLTSEERRRLNRAKSATEPMLIVTEAEARKKEKKKSERTKTWVFKAENVRDFGWASSRKFIWDAMNVKLSGKNVMAMSFYPKEGNPLWEQYSTKVVAHSLRTYSKYTFDYPYPVAISVHAANIGMEYPMICFNFGRPNKDGTYSEYLKYRMIGVIIHEVGHNYFPMIVNSDERQWTWMDEGLNCFLQYLTEQEWQKDFPSRRGPAYKITNYMKGDKNNITPIMTNAESLLQVGNNAYGKPSTALNILRETIMGRELFDYAFKQYANRWKFKHPSPADFFRTMEDASAVDLDWFWRGWFYTTDHVDISLAQVNWFQINTQNPEVEKPFAAKQDSEKTPYISDTRNAAAFPERMLDKDPTLKDFYNKYNPFVVDLLDEQEYAKYISRLDKKELDILNGNQQYYELQFENIGGLVMPIILEFTYIDGTKEKQHIPAEIWKKNDKEVSKVFVLEKEVMSIAIDPYLETADTDISNNHWPKRPKPSRFQLYKRRSSKKENLMQRNIRAEELEKGVGE